MKARRDACLRSATRYYEAGDPDAATVVLVHGGEPGQHRRDK